MLVTLFGGWGTQTYTTECQSGQWAEQMVDTTRHSRGRVVPRDGGVRWRSGAQLDWAEVRTARTETGIRRLCSRREGRFLAPGREGLEDDERRFIEGVGRVEKCPIRGLLFFVFLAL